MHSRALGVFGLISMVLAAGIVIWLNMGKTDGSVPHDTAVIRAGDRAVTSLIPACVEAPDSCKAPGWSPLTSAVVRRMGLSPGSCMVCSEANGEKKVTLRMMNGQDYEWIQDAAGNIREGGRAGGGDGRPGAPPAGPADPLAPAPE
jgi:hypothetical protein